MILRLISVLIYTLIVFIIGFNVGNIKLATKNIDKELSAAENLFKAQGDKPETIKASLEMIRIDRLNKASEARRQIISSIWIPSFLAIVNALIMIFLGK